SPSGKSALLAHLMALPLGDFDPYAAAPETEGLRSMVSLTRTELEMFLADAFEDPDPVVEKLGGGDLITTPELAATYDLRHGTAGRPTSSILVGRKLKQRGIEPVGRVRLSDG